MAIGHTGILREERANVHVETTKDLLEGAKETGERLPEGSGEWR